MQGEADEIAQAISRQHDIPCELLGIGCGALAHLLLGRAASSQLASAATAAIVGAVMILWFDRRSVRDAVARSTS